MPDEGTGKIIKDSLREALEEVLDSRGGNLRIDAHVHAQHHDWLATRIDKEKQRTEFYRNLKTKSLPVILVGLVTWLGSLVWTKLLAYFAEHYKP